MDKSKAFRVDWYPREAFIDFSRLSAEEIGVLMQIINLIYSQNKAIENDPKYIGRTCNITRSKCARIIEGLITKGDIYLDETGKINKKRCEYALKEIEERRKKYSENGKKRSELRWSSEQNQLDKDSQAISSDLTSTNLRTHKEPYINTHTSYDIEQYLKDSDREIFKKSCPRMSIYFYISEFNSEINEGKRTPPSKSPSKAFLKWSEIYFRNHDVD